MNAKVVLKKTGLRIHPQNRLFVYFYCYWKRVIIISCHDEVVITPNKITFTTFFVYSIDALRKEKKFCRTRLEKPNSSMSSFVDFH
mmetsp:Transcript_17826/g.36639  ORF Transcript_17826/g.36639 Transcript_17826/m.36639 type:complete len:86 (-) Transcript_17826:502-759(-)